MVVMDCGRVGKGSDVSVSSRRAKRPPRRRTRRTRNMILDELAEVKRFEGIGVGSSVLYVGLDVHGRQSTICILDENGKKLLTYTIRGSWQKVLAMLSRLKRPFEICFEASNGYGYLYDRLCKMSRRVLVAHPGHLRLIFRSKRKNDRVDAQKLAKLLYLDEVPPVWVPSVDVRAWRGMIEHRGGLVGERTRGKNGVRSLLRGHGIAAPKGLWTRAGMAWLRGVAMPTEFDGVRRDILVERIESLNGMIKRVEKVLDEKGRAHSGVNLLMTIPGVGIRTAEAVAAYMDDPRRFGTGKGVASYFGLVPCQDESAGKNRFGHITRQGPPTVRRLLTEAAWQGVRRSKRIRVYFERIQRGDSDRKKIAIVATAHYLVRVMHSMLRTGEVWRCDPAA